MKYEDIGMVTNGFNQYTSKELAQLFADNKFKKIQVFFNTADFPVWVYNGRPDEDEFSVDRACQVIENYQNAGLEVLSLGVYTNLLEPDNQERAKNIAHYVEMMKIASKTGIPDVATECGFIPGRRGLIRETFEDDWARLLDSFKQLAQHAEDYGVNVVLEPCFHDLVNSAKRARDFVSQVGSDNFRIQIDPGNLVTVNTEEEMFNNLAEVTASVHGKDRKLNADRGTLVGEGAVNWSKFLKLYQEQTPDKPLFIEYVTDDNFLKARDFLWGKAQN